MVIIRIGRARGWDCEAEARQWVLTLAWVNKGNGKGSLLSGREDVSGKEPVRTRVTRPSVRSVRDKDRQK